MDSRSLSVAQLTALATRLAAERDYFERLHQRMQAVGFPEHDPIATAARQANDAVSLLYRLTAAAEEEARIQAVPIPYTKRQGELMKRRGQIE